MGALNGGEASAKSAETLTNDFESIDHPARSKKARSIESGLSAFGFDAG